MHNNKKVLLTGATGFVGSAVRRELKLDGYEIVSVSQSGRDNTVACPLENTIDWTPYLSGVLCVVHTAARVHVMNERSADPVSLYRSLNVIPTLRLAEQAAACGVKRFVFLSSVKAAGEQSHSDGSPLTEADKPCPEDPYAQSKLEAELGLQQIAERSGLEVVVIRPPLIYGPGVKANFLALMRLVAKGVPLPIGGISNKRSLVGINNLVAFIKKCIEHPAAANQTFFVSDGADLSTSELVSHLSKALGRNVVQIPVPQRLLRFLASILGKGAAIDRLCGSLQVDISHSKKVLGWSPPVSVEQQMSETAADFYRLNRVSSFGLRKSGV